MHLAEIKPFHPRENPPAPQFDMLANLFLGKEVPLAALDHQDKKIYPELSPLLLKGVVSHRYGPGRKSAHNHKYRLSLQGYGPESDIEYRADEVPQCHELIAAYRTANILNNRASHNEPV